MLTKHLNRYIQSFREIPATNDKDIIYTSLNRLQTLYNFKCGGIYIFPKDCECAYNCYSMGYKDEWLKENKFLEIDELVRECHNNCEIIYSGDSSSVDNLKIIHKKTKCNTILLIPLLMDYNPDSVVKMVIKRILFLGFEEKNRLTDFDIKSIFHIGSLAMGISTLPIVLDIDSGFLNSAFESVTTGLLYFDDDGRLNGSNTSAEKILEIPLVGAGTIRPQKTRFLELFPDAASNGLKEKIVEVFDSGNAIKGFEFWYTPPLGGKKLLRCNILKLKGELGGYLKGITLAFEDITHDRKIQEQMERTSQMAALGGLAAGIAHEIRNPLAAIKGAVELLPYKIDNEQFREKFLQVIGRETSRINSIVEQLLEFSRPKEPHMELTCMNELINETLDLVTYALNKVQRERIVIKKELSSNIPKVNVDNGQIRQVFLNIILNGLEAMPSGGVMTISTKMDYTAKNLKVYFKDTGTGMNKETKKNIFNPFFTTKKSGTGLGLSVAHRIILDHHGSIDVESQEGQGTTFVISLPTN